MKEGSRISKLLSKMRLGEYDSNLELLELVFGDVTRVSRTTGKNLVQELVSRKYDENDCLLAIKTLFKEKRLDPNHLDKNGLNFIQNAINTGYSQSFICNCIRQTLSMGLDVNHKDSKGNTIIHSAIESTNYKGSFVEVLKLVYDYGFDVTSKNQNDKDISDLILETSKYHKIGKMGIISEMYPFVSRPKNLIVVTSRNKRS